MIAAVVLAAGRSDRMGRPKALLPIRGTTFLGAILDRLAASGVHEVRVVLGHAGGEVRDALALEDAIVVINADPDRGMLSSVRCGIAALPPGASGFLLWPVDHPLVSGETVARLVEAFEATGAPVVLPLHGGRRGHPVLFAAPLARELEAAPDGVGARGVVRAHERELVAVEVDDPGVVADIDTPEEYESAIGRPAPPRSGP